MCFSFILVFRFARLRGYTYREISLALDGVVFFSVPVRRCAAKVCGLVATSRIVVNHAWSSSAVISINGFGWDKRFGFSCSAKHETAFEDGVFVASWVEGDDSVGFELLM